MFSNQHIITNNINYWIVTNIIHEPVLIGASLHTISNTHTTPVRINGEPYVHKFCAFDNIWNITRRQAMSHVAKFHHVLGRGSWFSRWYVFLTYVSRTVSIKYLTCKYNIEKYHMVTFFFPIYYIVCKLISLKWILGIFF